MSEKTGKSAYQLNLEQQNTPQNTERTYSTRDVLSVITKLGQYNPERANQYAQKFFRSMQNSSSQYYNPYTQPTNKAVGNLAALGFDVSNIDDNFYAQNQWLKKYYVSTANTNGLSSTMTNKKASKEQKAAYNFDQLWKAEEQTKKAETEWAALQEELSYWAQRADKNYSDQDIIDRIDWSKYKTLEKMDAGRREGTPIELNRAVGYSQDAMYGVLWAARNGGSTGSIWQDMANSAGGTGWQENADISARLAGGTDTYSPYSVGSTMDKEGMYFGRSSFDQKWIDENSAKYLGGNDETAKKMFNNVQAAEKYTQQLEKELDEMNKSIESLVKTYYSNPDLIVDIIRGGTTLYKDLFDLDETFETTDLKNTTRAVNYRWKDIEQRIRDMCAEENSRKNPVALVNDPDYWTTIASPKAAVTNTEEQNALQFLKEQPAGEDGDWDWARETLANDPENKKALEILYTRAKGMSLEQSANYSMNPEEMAEAKEMAAAFTEPEKNDWQPYGQWKTEQMSRSPIKPFTEAEVALDDAYRADLDAIAPTVQDAGTDAEKAAFQTGRTGFYDETVKRLTDVSEEYYQKVSSQAAQKKVAGSYQDAYGTTYEYENRQNDVTKQQEYLDKEVLPEWEKLSKKKEALDVVAGATEEEYQNLMSMKNLSDEEKNQEWFLRTLADNPDDQNALTSLYKSVTGEFYDTLPDNALERAKTWYEYITNPDAAALTYLTDEEETKFYELDQAKTALEKDIADGEAYLSSNQKDYLKAKRDREYLKSLYETTNPGGNMVNQIEYVYKVGSMKARTAYTDYETYDSEVKDGKIDRATASANASKDALDYQNSVDYLQAAVADLEKYGIPLTDEQQRNIDSQIEYMTDQAKRAGYVALDGAADFGAMVKKGREEALKKPGSSYANALADLYHGDNIKLVSMVNNHDNKANAMLVMSDEEMNRYFYLMGKEGETVANEYLDYLTDPDKGVLTVRRMIDLKENIQKVSGDNILTAGAATTGAILASIVKGASSFGYKVGQWVSGKEVSPYNAAYGPMEYSEAYKAGSKDFLHKVFGEGSTVSKVADKVYDVAEGIGEYYVQSLMFGGLFEGLNFAQKASSAAKFGIKMLQSGAEVAISTLNSAEQTYRSVLQMTGDEKQAEVKSATSFVTGLISHAVIMNGIHKAFEANPTDVKSMFSGLFQQVLKTDAAVAGSTIVTSTIDKVVDKAFGESSTEWGNNFRKYKEIYHSETLAAQMADQKMWEDVCSETVQAVINSTIRTGLTYGTKAAIKGAKAGAAKMKDLWKGVQQVYKDEFISPKQAGEYEEDDSDPFYKREAGYNPETHMTGTFEDVPVPEDMVGNQLGVTRIRDRTNNKPHDVIGYVANNHGTVDFITNMGERIPFEDVVSFDENGNLSGMDQREFGLLNEARAWYLNEWLGGDEGDQVTETPVNDQTTEAPVINKPTPTPASAKDISILGQSFGANDTGSATGASAVLYLGDGDAAKAAGQALVAKAAGGDPKTATAALHYMAVNHPDPLWKEDVIAAALTSGNGNKALLDIFNKVQNGETVTADDVNALTNGVASDRKSDPEGFDESIKDAKKQNRIANKTVEKASKKKDTVVAKEKAAKDANANLNTAKKNKKNADAKVQATADSLKAATEIYIPEGQPVNKEAAGKYQQTTNQLEGDVNNARVAGETVETQQRKADEAQQDLSNTNRDVMNEARQEAIPEVEQEMQQEEEASTEAAVNALKPKVTIAERDEQGRKVRRGRKVVNKTVRVYDTEGRPVDIIGVYDITDDQVVLLSKDGRLVTGHQHGVGPAGSVDITRQREIWLAIDELEAMTQAERHPENAPAAYLPTSFKIDVNGTPVQIIGLAGKEMGEDYSSPVLLGLDGNLYSAEDENIGNQLRGTNGEMVFNLFDETEDSLPPVDNVPRIETTEANENGAEVREPVQEAQIPIPGTEGEGNNEGELPSAPGRDGGLGDNSDVGSDGGQAVNGGTEEGPTESDGSTVRGDPARLLSKQTVKGLKGKGVTDLNVNLTNADTFSPALDAGRASNAHGLFVDPQSPEELIEKGAIMIMSNNGLAGAAVATVGDEAGNIFGVFKNSRSRARNASASLIIQAVAQGGNKLDCYDGGLRRLYAKVGFVPVARVAWNDAFHRTVDEETGEVTWDDGWNYERDGRPDVVVWMLKPGETAESIAEKYGLPESEGGFHMYSDEEIANLPLFEDTVDENGETTEWGYDKALAYRNECLAKGEIPQSSLPNNGTEPPANGTPTTEPDVNQTAPPDGNGRNTKKGTGVGNIISSFRLSASDHESIPQISNLTDANGVRFGYTFINKEGKNVINLSKEYDTPETRAALEEAGYTYDDKSGEWVQNDTQPAVNPVGGEVPAEDGTLPPDNQTVLPGTPPENPDGSTPPAVNDQPNALTGNPVNGAEGLPSTPTPVNTDGSTPTPSSPRDGVSNPRIGEHQWGREGAQESPLLSPETKEWLLDHNEYVKDSNREQVERAVAWLESHVTQDDPEGFHNALHEVETDGFNSMTADGQVRILTLLRLAQKNHDADAEVRLSDIYNNAGTDPARALQARKIFRLMTPAGRELALKREAQKIQDEYNSRGKKGLVLKISDETLRAAAEARSEEEFINARRRMERELAEQIPSDWRLKARTFRMAAMLANPRTHIRNLEGNFSFKLPLWIKNTIGYGLERAAKVPVGERTKSMKKSQEAKEFAARDALAMKDVLRGTSKYFEVGAVESNRKAFGQGKSFLSRTLGRGVQWAADKNGDLLEKEDWISLNNHYQNALAGYMTANGYTAKDMKGETLKKARAYAVKEAQKATYRDTNKLAKWFSDQSNKPAAVQFAINAIMPFTKTPMNIVKRGVEYSPFGLAYSVATAKRQLDAYKEWEESGFKGKQPKNAKSPGEVFDRIASGLTGTMLAGLGAYLSSLGILKVKPTEAEKRKGSQDYSIELFGHSFGVGNLLPTILPVLLGGSVYEEMSNLKNGDADLGDVLQSFGNMVEPSLETTMWMSWSSLLDTGRYTSDDESMTSLLAQKVLANFASSFIPSVVGATTRVIDPTRRKTYIESGDKMSVWTALKEQTENKLPFLSSRNVPYLNKWGEEDTQNRFMAFLHNFILPDKIQELSDSKLDDMLEEITTKTGVNVEPNATSEKTLTVNGEKIKLNDKQWYQYSSAKGQISKSTLQELIERPEFIAMQPEVQAELVKKVYKYSKAKAALELFPDKKISDGWTRNALAADNVIDFIFTKEEEAARDASNDSHRASLIKSINENNFEAAAVDIDALRTGGVSDSSIKSSITKKVQPLYKTAAEEGDFEEMERLRVMLMGLGLGYENFDFSKWLGNNSSALPETNGYIASATGAPGRSMAEDEYYDEDEEVVDDLGQYGAGNIDLYNRIPVRDEDGYIETVKSFSTNIDGKEVLLPTVIDGRIVSEEEAIEHYLKTGEYLGIFDTPEDATKYAIKLHKIQEKLYPN